jgi:hypothetical protein
MTRNFLIIALLVLSVLAACAPRVRQAPPGASLSSLGEDVLAFGRIRWIQNFEERKTYSNPLGWNVSLKVVRIEDMKTGRIGVENDGRFFALLPKGTYIVRRIDWRDPWDGPHWLMTKLAFQVAPDHHAYYLGTVVVDIKTERDIIGGLHVKDWELSIEDEADGAMESLRTRHPGQEVEVAKSLIFSDPSIPDIDELTRQEMLLDEVLRSLQFGTMTIQ